MPKGGKRENAGRKSKFSEETVKVNLTKKVPISKVEDFKGKVNDILKSYEDKQTNQTKKK